MLGQLFDDIVLAFESDGFSGRSGGCHEIQIFERKIILFEHLEERGSYDTGDAYDCQVGFLIHHLFLLLEIEIGTIISSGEY
jgi:hypothetical protein